MVRCKKCGHVNTSVSFRCAGCGAFYESIADNSEPKRVSLKYKLVGGVVVATTLVVVLIAAYVYASPYLRLWQLRNGIINKDHETVSSFVDFPTLKQSLKDEMNAYLMAEMAKNQEMKDNPFSGLALMMAPAMVNNMVDALVTPAGVERLLSGNLGKNEAADKTKPPDFFNDPKVDLGYHSLNEFWVVVLNPKNEKIAIVFKRHWIGDWKLSGVKMPR